MAPNAALGSSVCTAGSAPKADAGTRSDMVLVQDRPHRVGVVCADESVLSDWFSAPVAQSLSVVQLLPSALGVVKWRSFDLGVLHRPSIETFETLREVTEGLPLLVVTESAEGSTRARWLELGADDCLSERVCPRELAARLGALLRRRDSASRSTAVVTVGRLELHPARRTAYLDGARLELSSIEFDLLSTFAQYVGEVLSRERLLGLIHGSPDEAFDRSIDVQVSRLRAKLGDDPRAPKLLKTVRGRGYLLTPM